MYYCYDYFFVLKLSLQNYHQIVAQFSRKVIVMTFPTYLTKKTGSVYKILSKGTDDQLFVIIDFFGEVFANIVVITVSICILLYTDARMTVIMLAPLPIMLIIGTLIYKKLAPTQWAMDQKYDETYNHVGNIMSNF